MTGPNGKHERTAMDRKKIIVVAAIALLLLAAIIGVALWEKGNNEFSGQGGTTQNTLTYQGKEYEFRQDIETILILGLDAFKDEEDDSYNNDKQADFLLLLVIDRTNETCRAIPINRDTMAEMNVLGVAGDKVGTITQQLALAHTYGNGREVSCRNVANAVSGLLKGVKIDHYVSVTMEAVSIYNDTLGGVTLEVLDDFTHVDAALVKGETVTLKGEQALTYIRARHGMEDPTNTARMKRQKQYMEALHAQTRAAVAGDEDFLSRAALKISNYMVSDCSGNKLETLLDRLAQYELGGILEIEGDSTMGEKFLEFHPDEDSLMKVVVESFCREKNK